MDYKTKQNYKRLLWAMKIASFYMDWELTESESLDEAYDKVVAKIEREIVEDLQNVVKYSAKLIKRLIRALNEGGEITIRRNNEKTKL